MAESTGRRRADQRRPGRGLSCQAYGLGYRSQRVGWVDRAHARLARLYRKLGTDYHGLRDEPPPRPKSMRQRTYARLWAEVEATRGELAGAVPPRAHAKR